MWAMALKYDSNVSYYCDFSISVFGKSLSSTGRFNYASREMGILAKHLAVNFASSLSDSFCWLVSLRSSLDSPFYFDFSLHLPIK